MTPLASRLARPETSITAQPEHHSSSMRSPIRTSSTSSPHAACTRLKTAKRGLLHPEPRPPQGGSDLRRSAACYQYRPLCGLTLAGVGRRRRNTGCCSLLPRFVVGRFAKRSYKQTALAAVRYGNAEVLVGSLGGDPTPGCVGSGRSAAGRARRHPLRYRAPRRGLRRSYRCRPARRRTCL